ncbi:hypothetical protein HID58_071720 [Brassica napus]|uniref:Transmembrane protein n=1 Tax=Brassica napus TaxID=3708 RepID=A0ABQ7Z2I8_BRANA|nr:hypothetical protein HID58_071720 [Brassica napus]
MKAAKKQIHAVTTWVRQQPPKVKAFLGVVSAMAAFVFLRKIVHNHDHDDFFVATEGSSPPRLSTPWNLRSYLQTRQGDHCSLPIVETDQ